MAIISLDVFERVKLMKNNDNNSKELPSKLIFDKLNTEKKKPEFVDPGLYNKSRDLSKSLDGTMNNSILADTPNFYKHNGTSMENSGYFIIPRIVTTDPRYKSARIKYQKVLHILFENAAYAATTHAIGTETINIAIGQLCITVRKFAELCNEGVKFKDDFVDKNTIERASHFWARCGFVRQEVIHDKTLLTITVPAFYRKEKKLSETISETEVRQNRDTKEEYKEDKEDNISSSKGTFVPSEFATSLLSDFYSSLFISIPDFPRDKAKKTKTQYQAADRLLKKYKLEVIKEVIEYAHIPRGFWIKFVHSMTYLEKKFVTLQEQIRSPLNKNIIQNKTSSHNNPLFQPKEQKPLTYKNKISFNTEKKK